MPLPPSTSETKVRQRRRILPLLVAGLVLLTAGLGFTTFEAQTRIDLAAEAYSITDEQFEQLADAGITDIGQSNGSWLVFESMASGAPVMELELVINEMDDGVSVGWMNADEVPVVRALGGWQPKPLAGLTLGGLALIIGSLFVAASRWSRRHPQPLN